MNRRPAVSVGVLALGCLVGCQSSRVMPDPFLGPTRVPPPATGSIRPPAGTPYYEGAPLQGAPPPFSSGAVPRDDGSWRSVAGRDIREPQQSDVSQSLRVLKAHHGVVYLDDEVKTASRETRADAVESETDKVVLASSSEAEPPIKIPKEVSVLRPSSKSPNHRVMAENRPARDDSGWNENGRPSRSTSTARTIPAKFVGTTVNTTRSASRTLQPRFGHDRHYGWLTGQLEYLQSKDLWKLRYIPFHGKTDEFGGSVMISNPDVLQGLTAGDYVKVRGSLTRRSNNAPSFAPPYEVEHVERTDG